jgi:hypothetical protein
MTGPLPAADPPEGAVVIAGGGRLPASIRDEFIPRAGGVGQAKVVGVPTAGAVADEQKGHASFLGRAVWLLDAKAEPVELKAGEGNDQGGRKKW